MKTPRELLLERHQHARRALDELSFRIVRQQAPARGIGFVDRFREWLWPSPVAWGAVAAVWAIIAVLNLASPSEAHPAIAAATPRQTAETIQALREQKRLLVELVQSPRIDAEPPRAPAPHSERQDGTVAA